MYLSEIFYSIQGESTYSGLPCVFIRLAECNLRCSYCDTKFAYERDCELSVDEIIKEVSQYSCNLVEITGGEPLLQNDTVILMERLLSEGKCVLLETNGSCDISSVPEEVRIILDIKCPSSGMSDMNCLDNISYLKSIDEVKFVVGDRKDFDWAISVIKQHRLELECSNLLMAPVFKMLNPSELSKWILKSELSIRVQLQLQKYIWDPEERER